MSGIGKGDGGIDPGGSAMNAGTLEALSVAEAAAPYGFDEFERRGARRIADRRRARHGLVASFATVAVAVLAAIAVLQPRAPDVGEPALVYDAGAFVPAEEPAVVDVGQLVVRESLADRIALLDLQLTEGRAYAMPEDELAQLAATRDQLERSLRGVAYAHALMTQ